MWLVSNARFRGVFAAFAVTAVLLFGLPVRAQEAPADEVGATTESFLDSSAWHSTMRRLNDWFSVQLIYSDEEVVQIKQDMEQATRQMSLGELQSYQQELEEKLAVLDSPEALEARSYARQYLRAASAARAEAFRAQLPDVMNMTVAQIKESLYDLHSARATTVAEHRAFERQRDELTAAMRSRHQPSATGRYPARYSVYRAGSRPIYGPYVPRPSPRYPGFGTRGFRVWVRW